MPVEQRFLSYDATPIVYRHWPHKAAAAKAVVIVLHGMGEHGGRYRRFAEYLNETGVDVYAMDLRGYGRSGGRRFHVRRFEDYLEDVKALHAHVAKQHPGTPLFLLGHSMGGLIAAAYAGNRNAALSPLRGVILSSPLFGVALKIPFITRVLAKIAGWVAPTWIQQSGITPERLTHDSEIIREYAKDPLIHQELSAGLFAQTQRYSVRARELGKALNLPVLVLQAGEDYVVSVKSTQHFYKHILSPNKKLILYPNFYHELLNEARRNEVFSDIAVWLSKLY